MSLLTQHILKDNYGYNSFRPLQEEIIDHIVSQKDALVLMPTGGGKSLCFQIPALAMKGTAIVVSPLISLMKDQVDGLHANGIAAETINSHNTEKTNYAIKEMCAKGEIKILYISPERLITETPWLQKNVKVSLIAIDEAHCISQWGHDFRPEYTKLGCLHDQFPSVPMIALTATADKITKTDIINQLHLRNPKVFIGSFDRPNLSLEVRCGYPSEDKLNAIVDTIHRHQDESGIIYCLSRKGTEQLVQSLKDKGISAKAYHAGLSSKERTKIQEEFINDKINVICATVAFGMGIDKSDIRYVIHNNLPKNIESFYQEIGRGGRDGMDTETILFYNPQDIITLKKFVEKSGQRDINLEKLRRMQEYAEAKVCRRRILLNYFGEISDCKCGNCDVCKKPPQHFDGTIIVQKALSAIKRTKEEIDLIALTDILRGSLTQDVINHGYEKIKTFGAGNDISVQDWHDYLLQMLQMGFIEIAYNKNKHLKITTLGNEVLFGRQKAELAITQRKESHIKRKEKDVTSHDFPQATQTSDSTLFKKLKKVRKTIADEKGWPAYVVMNDKSLQSIATKKPTTLTDFGNCYGIGEYKKRTFGRRFLIFLKEHLRINERMDEKKGKKFLSAQTEKSAPQETKTYATGVSNYMKQQKREHTNAYAKWTKEDDNKLIKLYSQGLSIKELCEIFGRNEGAIRSRIKKLVDEKTY